MFAIKEFPKLIFRCSATFYSDLCKREGGTKLGDFMFCSVPTVELYRSENAEEAYSIMSEGEGESCGLICEEMPS